MDIARWGMGVDTLCSSVLSYGINFLIESVVLLAFIQINPWAQEIMKRLLPAQTDDAALTP